MRTSFVARILVCTALPFGGPACRVAPPALEPEAGVPPPAEGPAAPPEAADAAPAWSPMQVVMEADRALAAGDVRSAAFLLGEALQHAALEDDARGEVRLRLALLHAEPRSEIHDMEMAQAHLAQVMEANRGSSTARLAVALQGLLLELTAQRADRAAAEEEVDRLSARAAEAEKALGTCQAEVERIKAIILETRPTTP